VQIGHPSSNLIVTSEGRRVLFDAGFGSDAALITRALDAAGTPAAALDLVVNTHWHSDHAGGNSWLQAGHGLPVAAARADAELVNHGLPGACLAEWLDQPVGKYRVDQPLDPDQTLTAGPLDWEVLATPGHTPTHLSFYQADEQLLVLGDAVHASDVGWVNLALDGPGALDAALATVERLAALPVHAALPGHGPAITDPAAAFAAAHARYQRMRDDPQRAAWHACKRILAFALMINDGIPLGSLHSWLASRPWLAGHAAAVFGTAPGELARDLLTEMRRTGAVAERDGKLICLTPHHAPPPSWLRLHGSARR